MRRLPIILLTVALLAGCGDDDGGNADNTDPSIGSVSSPSDNANYTVGDDIPVSGSVSDVDGDTLTVTVEVYQESDGQSGLTDGDTHTGTDNLGSPDEQGNFSGTVSTTGMEAGTFYLVITVDDEAGGSSSMTRQVTLEDAVDPMAPVFEYCTVSNTAIGAALSIQCRVSSPAQEDLSFQLLELDIPNSEVGNVMGLASIGTTRGLDASDVGLYVLVVEAQDQSGRATSYSNYFQITDNEATWTVNGTNSSGTEENIANQVNSYCSGFDETAANAGNYDFSPGDPSCIQDGIDSLSAQQLRTLEMYLPSGSTIDEWLDGVTITSFSTSYQAN